MAIQQMQSPTGGNRSQQIAQLNSDISNMVKLQQNRKQIQIMQQEQKFSQGTDMQNKLITTYGSLWQAAQAVPASVTQSLVLQGYSQNDAMRILKEIQGSTPSEADQYAYVSRNASWNNFHGDPTQMNYMLNAMNDPNVNTSDWMKQMLANGPLDLLSGLGVNVNTTQGLSNEVFQMPVEETPEIQKAPYNPTTTTKTVTPSPEGITKPPLEREVPIIQPGSSYQGPGTGRVNQQEQLKEYSNTYPNSPLIEEMNKMGGGTSEAPVVSGVKDQLSQAMSGKRGDGAGLRKLASIGEFKVGADMAQKEQEYAQTMAPPPAGDGGGNTLGEVKNWAITQEEKITQSLGQIGQAIKTLTSKERDILSEETYNAVKNSGTGPTSEQAQRFWSAYAQMPYEAKVNYNPNGTAAKLQAWSNQIAERNGDISEFNARVAYGNLLVNAASLQMQSLLAQAKKTLASDPLGVAMTYGSEVYAAADKAYMEGVTALAKEIGGDGLNKTKEIAERSQALLEAKNATISNNVYASMYGKLLENNMTDFYRAAGMTDEEIKTVTTFQSKYGLFGRKAITGLQGQVDQSTLDKLTIVVNMLEAYQTQQAYSGFQGQTQTQTQQTQVQTGIPTNF